MILRKDPFSEGRLRELGLNERQMRAVAYVRENGKITNTEYQRLESISERTATRDLTALARLGVLVSLGTTGRGTAYALKPLKPPQSRHKAATKGQ